MRPTPTGRRRTSRPEALSTADDDLSLYSRLERDALLLSFGDATDCEADTREAPLRGGERPWRFIGMLLPPYS